MLYYINTFFIYSFFGFLMETFLKTFFFHGMNNGILHGPWIPVYGFGVVIIIFMMRLVFNNLKAKRWVKVILTFLSITILLTLLEFAGGILIEKLFNKVFWDYSNMKFNFGHYICLEISLIWGVFSMIIIYLVKPKIDPIIKKIPIWLTILVSIIFIIDVIFTFL